MGLEGSLGGLDLGLGFICVLCYRVLWRFLRWVLNNYRSRAVKSACRFVF